MILGLLALAVLLGSIGFLFFFSLPLAATAWWLGSRSLDSARQQPGQATGVARVARVLGMVGVGLSVASGLMWLLFGLLIGAWDPNSGIYD